MRVNVPVAKAYRLLNHGPVALVTSRAGGRSNVMTCAWVTPLDVEPPLITAVISSDSFTRELIDSSGVFALNLATVGQARAVLACGATSGRDGDKFASAGLATFDAEAIDVPLIEGCAAWLECRLCPDEEEVARSHDLLIAEVVAAHADEEIFRDGQWHFEEHPERRTLHHLGGEAFLASGERIEPG